MIDNDAERLVIDIKVNLAGLDSPALQRSEMGKRCSTGATIESFCRGSLGKPCREQIHCQQRPG